MTASQPNNEAIFHAARGIPDPDCRREYVRAECGGDESRIVLVQALLAAADSPDSLLDRPAVSNSVATINQPSAAAPGTVIGRYKLLEQIGEGGMGTVWMAQQTEPVKRVVALKLIKAGMDSRQVIARFEAERQALALMDHANIARVLDAGTTSAGRPYFVMDLVKGVPITKYCDEHHLTPRQRLELFIPVCQAVQHAHQKGIIHRDLKPSNVLVALYDGKPVPKVIDFGVAKAAGQQLTDKTLVTGFGNIVGTLEYMSPEQAEVNQLDIDTRSDIYSLGVLLYELLAGSPPFSRKELEKAGMLEMLRVIREDEPSKPSTKLSSSAALPSLSANRGTEPAKLTKLVRGELDWIVMKALEKDRGRRYETANGFSMDVQRYLADEPVLACPPSTAYRLRKLARRNKAALAAAAAIALSLLAGIVGTTWQAIQATRERDRAIAAEGLAQKRLVWAETAESHAKDEAKRADAEGTKARTEAAIAQAVNLFLTDDLLAQADPWNEPDREIKLRTVLDRAAEKIGERFAQQPLVEAGIHTMIGDTYKGLSMYKAAQPHFERALELRRANLGLEHLVTVSAMQKLAWILRAQGHYEETTSLFLKTLEIRQRVLGEEHPETLASMSALAWTYRHLNRSDDSEQLYLKTLELQRRVLGEDHLATADSMHALALLYTWNLRKYAAAESLFLKALAIRHLAVGDENPDTLYTMNSLAALYGLQRKYAEAEPLLLKALSIRQRVLGEEHVATLQSMSELARIYRAQQRYAEAESLLVKALEGRRTHDPQHPETLGWSDALAQMNIEHGVSLAKMGQWDQATANLAKAIDLNPETFSKAFNQLQVYVKPDELEKLLRQALTAFQKRATDSPTELSHQKEIARIHKSLGQVLQATQPADAEIAFHRAIVIYRNLVDASPADAENRQKLGHSCRQLAALLDRKSKAEERVQLWREAATQFEVLLNLEAASPESQEARFFLAGTCRLLADDLAAQKQTAGAEAEYRKAVHHFESLSAASLVGWDEKVRRRTAIEACFANLIKILTAAKRTQEAEQVHLQAITLYEKLAAERPDVSYFNDTRDKHQAAMAKLKQQP